MNSIVVAEKLNLIKTKYSPYLYAIYGKLNNKNEIRRSSKTADILKAMAFAIHVKMKIEVKFDNGIQFTTKIHF